MAAATYKRELFWLGVFGVAFGYLEAAVVVYLRLIVYPGGFAFPLRPIPSLVLATEVGREVATIMMLVAAAWAAGGPRLLRLGRFLYCFGLWDIFYYVGLKSILGWPPSVWTWDILFLIPAPWSAPVLAPVVVAVVFIAVGSLGIIKGGAIRPRGWQWFVAAMGGGALVVTFLWNAGACVRGEAPPAYPWPLFGVGLAALLTASGGAFMNK